MPLSFPWGFQLNQAVSYILIYDDITDARPWRGQYPRLTLLTLLIPTLLFLLFTLLLRRSVRQLSVSYGNPESLSSKVKKFVDEKAALCKPSSIHICDGSEEEAQFLADLLIKKGTWKKLDKYENW